MDDDKLNDKVHPPTSSALAQRNDNSSVMNMIENENNGAFSHNVRRIGRNSVTYPPDQSSATPSPWRQTLGNNQTNPKAPFDTSNSLAVDLNHPPNFQYPTNIAGNVPNPYRQYYPHPQRDNLINVQPQFGQNPGLNRNFSLSKGNNPEVIDLTLEDGNVQCGNSFYGPGSGKNVFYQPQDTEVTSSFNQNQINASQLGSSRREDEIRRAIEKEYKLTDVTSPEFINKWTAKLAAHPPPVFGEYSRFRNNMGGLPSSQNSMGGLHSSKNNMGRLPNPQNSMGGLPSTPNIMSQLPNSQINLGVFPSVRNRMGGLPSSQNDMGALANSQNNMGLFPNSQTNMGLLPNSQTNMGGLPSSQMHLGVFPSMRNNMGENNSSINNVGTMRNAVYVQPPQANEEHGLPKHLNSNLGYMPDIDTRFANVDPYEVLRHRLHTPSGQFSDSRNELASPVQMGGVSNPTPGFITSDAAQKFYQQETLKYSERNMAARRYMESKFNRDISGQVPNPRNSAAQAGNEAAQLLLRRSNQLAGQTVQTPQNYGHPLVYNPHGQTVQTPQNYGHPLVSNPHGQTVQTPQNYGHPLVSNLHGNPSLKRGSIHSNPSSFRVQRRRTMGQYQGSSRPQTPPVGAAQISTSRGGSVGGLKPSGYKCMICKRDLAFSPEGPIQQPSIPPHVAVLPCQHTFHDRCLELITPEDQKTDPPCIPCAMGEK